MFFFRPSCINKNSVLSLNSVSKIKDRNSLGKALGVARRREGRKEDAAENPKADAGQEALAEAE